MLRIFFIVDGFKLIIFFVWLHFTSMDLLLITRMPMPMYLLLITRMPVPKLKIMSNSWQWQCDYQHVDIPVKEMETGKP